MRRNSDSLLIVQGSEEYNRLQKCKFTTIRFYIDAQMAPFNLEFDTNYIASLEHQFETLKHNYRNNRSREYDMDQEAFKEGLSHVTSYAAYNV